MRSPLVTLILLATAVGLAVLGGISLKENGLDRFFRGKPLPEGAHVYQFSAKQVRRIQISHAGTTARFQLVDGVWQAVAPWQDRMDPRLADQLIVFTLATTVQDAIPMEKVDTRLVGLKTGNILVRLADGANQEIAHYVLGRRTAWFVEQKGGDPIPTVFLRPLEHGRRDFLYACTGDPHPIFSEGLQRLRDHRPFYFNPKFLASVRIRGPEGELTLTRKSPDKPWYISKPLELLTEKDAVRRLVEGLYQLTAVKVSDPDEITPPATEGEATEPIEIAIRSFGEKEETTLRVTPRPEPDALTAPATVSNRKAVFELPLRPGAAKQGEVALFSLPLTVNDLRDKKLTHLNIASLHSILISPADGESILISRTPKSPWLYVRGAKSEEANERSIYNLLKAVTETDVAGFVTDTATDLKPYGLDNPLLVLRFLSFNNEGLELRFGRDPKGALLANRLGSPTVMKIDESLLALIATRPYQWKSTRLWNLSRVDIIGIELQHGTNPPLQLAYAFLDESWRATRDGKDATADLNENRANFLLEALEGLRVARWLGPNDSAAATALLDPAFTVRVLQKTVDDLGDSTGIVKRTLILSPVSKSPQNQFFYGMVEGNPNFFVIDKKTWDNLNVDLFEE